jgi:hypothetical protein
MDTLILFNVEILGHKDEPAEVCMFEATFVIPFPGTMIRLNGPNRDLTGGRSEPEGFYCRPCREDFLFLPEEDKVIIHLEDKECLTNKRRNPKTILKEYLNAGWKESQ